MDDESASLTRRPVSRRGFVLAAVGSAAVLVLSSCVPSPPEPTPTPVDDDYANVLNKQLDDAAPGSRVVLPKGKTVVHSTVRLRSGVSLHAHPNGSTLVLADGTDAPFVLAAGVEDVAIVGIRFDGGRQSRDSVSLQFDGCSRVRVEKCELVRMKHAVHVYSTRDQDSTEVEITGCDFRAITDFAVRVDQEAENVRIADNTVWSVAKGSAPSPTAIYVRGKDIIVQDNVVKSSYDTGIMAVGTAARNITVRGNTLSTDMVAIYFGSGAENGLVQRNTISSKRDFGIHVHDRDGRKADLVIDDNTIGPTGKSGVQVEGSENVRVTDNAITEPGQSSDNPDYWRCGVAVTALRGNGARSVIVQDNTVTATGAGMSYGVLLSSGTGNVIVTGNRITGADTRDIQVDAGGPYLVEGPDGAVIEQRGTTSRW